VNVQPRDIRWRLAAFFLSAVPIFGVMILVGEDSRIAMPITAIIYAALGIFLGNYYAVAMLVDFTPPTASGGRVNKGRDALHHAVSSLQMKLVNSACTQTAAGSVPPQSCFGCCGIRCACISGLNGAAIYTSACAAHDQCTGQYGYLGSFKHCKAAFARAVASMWSYFQVY